MNAIIPNTFIIGAQKSATTSLFNWISQHPEVCGPSSIKDFPFFLKDEFFNKGIESLKKEYLASGFENHKIILQGSVQYMFDSKAIKRIYNFNNQSKLICVLRNPVERAISAYTYFKKINIEPLSFKEALEVEEKRGQQSLQAYFDFTYKAHGLYSKQLYEIYKFFPQKHVLVLLYDDVKSNPNEVIKNVFNFLGISKSFRPEFRILNATGKVKYQFLQNLVFNKSKHREYFVNNFLDKILPLHKRTKIRWALNQWNTSRSKAENSIKEDYIEERILLKQFFKKDIEELERILNINLNIWQV